MAAFIPSRRDPEVNATAMARVRDDKERESGDGFDGTWVAHPDLVPLATEIFDGVLGDRPNQKDRLREEVAVTADQLRDLTRPRRDRDRGGLPAQRQRRHPVPRCLARRQRRGRDQQPDGGRRDGRDLPLAALAVADDRQRSSRTGARPSADLYQAIRDEELARLGGARRRQARLAEAAGLLDRLVLDDEFAEFLTQRAYSLLD